MATKLKFPPKPPSSIYKGGVLSASGFLPDISTFHIIRDGFELSTWILIGASLQCILLLPFLQIRPSYAVLPALSLLAYRFVRGILMCVGLVRHPYADGVLPGKMAAVLPQSVDIDGLKKDDEEEGGICVIMLFARCHSPLGILSPQYFTLGQHMRSLLTSLDTHAPYNGYLGGSSFNNACDRTTCSELLTLCYFSSHASLQAFAHGEEHREIWEWWKTLVKEGKAENLSTAHEVFRVRKGDWEGVYANHYPSFFAATQHLVKDGEGYKWVSPLVDAKGKNRSALGRMGKSNGRDNEAYGEEPYANV